MREEFVWVEKYRPHTIQECILPQGMKSLFQEFVNKGELINMLLHGTSGVGKTTVALAMCEEMACDHLLINGSEESGIDVLRTKIRSFASSSSLSDKKKVVIIDEASNMSPAMQEGMKGFIEEFSTNCRFIFTCNNKNKIIAPIHSRTKVIEFTIPKEEKIKMAAKFLKRIHEILNAEHIEFHGKTVALVLTKFFPDYRRTLNELQWYSSGGKIDEGILANITNANFDVLIESLKEKDFKKMRAWVVNNDLDPSTFFRDLYDRLEGRVQELPELIVALNEYAYKSAFVADQGINFSSCAVELMSALTWK